MSELETVQAVDTIEERIGAELESTVEQLQLEGFNAAAVKKAMQVVVKRILDQFISGNDWTE